MKALRYILPGIVILVIVGLLCYQGFIQNNLDSSSLTRGILIIAGAVLTMLRPKKKQVTNKKALYQKAYGKFIQNAFYEDPKLEKKFYSAIHDYNQNKPAAAIAKLEKLRGECSNSNELRAVTVFTALCLDDMKLYGKAIEAYDYARRIRDDGTLASNMGLCYERLGNFEQAEKAYQQSIDLDPKSEYVHNNLAVLYFRQGDYETALTHAKNALNCNERMPQALSAAAICSALLGFDEDYKQYYRRAVAAGYDGETIKRAIKNLNPEL